MIPRIHAVPVALAVLLVLLALWAYQGRRRERAGEQAAARAEVIRRYLQALEANDRDGVEKFAPKDYDTAEEIDDRLRRFGGVRADGAEIQIETDISPDVYVVRIRAFGSGGRQTAWIENLFWRDGAWRLVLGRARHGFRPSSSIQRPPP